MEQCPKCESKKVKVGTGKGALVAITLMMGAFITTIGLFILPLLILGIGMMLMSPLILLLKLKENGSCLDCYNRWKIEHTQ